MAVFGVLGCFLLMARFDLLRFLVWIWVVLLGGCWMWLGGLHGCVRF